MKRIFWIAVALTAATTAGALEVKKGTWTVALDETTNMLTIINDGETILDGVEAKAATGGMVLESKDAVNVSTSQMSVTDVFGSGTLLDIIYTMSDGMKMIQSITLYDDIEYMTVRLALTKGDGSTVSSPQLIPLSSTKTTAPMPEQSNNRMLFVPWDNDGFIGYESNALNKDMHSYAVTAIYNTTSRYGIVTGAVDHDIWKSAIHVDASDRYNLNQVECISGYTDEHSHDSLLYEGRYMQHGAVVADTVRSSRFIFGCFDDWRVGMETFGQACTLVTPRREWAGGVPYGWSSWGVMQTLISYDGVIDCGDFIRDNLMPHGFHDANGKVVLSLDAWWNDNLSATQVRQFVEYCKSNNMIPGLYYGPFCDFAGNPEGTVPGTNGKYKFKDLWLKVNGRYKIVDGAYCLDPTHPGTKMFIMNDIKKFRDWGVEYLKCDFMSNGAIEADSWYNKKCYTGVQAYNEGMAFMLSRAGDDLYINLSIAPIFPFHYAHGRRISCDAWGTIDHTKYVMNNTSYGWWLNQIYFANDPDHLVMKMRDNGGNESEGINRARLTSGVVTGAYITGDNFSFRVDAGYPAKSREQALKLLTNEAVNEIPRTCHSFRPVYGNSPQTLGAETLMTYDNGTYVYLAALSYKVLSPTTGTMPFADLGINAAEVSEIKELWTDADIAIDADGFKYNCPYNDARIYRITRKGGTGITGPVSGQLAIDGTEVVAESSPVKNVAVYDMSGRCIYRAACNSYRVSLPVSEPGLYIVKANTEKESKTVKIKK